MAKKGSLPARHRARAEIIALSDQGGLTHAQIAARVGTSARVVRREIEYERLIREREAPALESLSKSALGRLQRALAKEEERLASKFWASVDAKVAEILVNTLGPRLAKEQAQAKRVILSRKGLMTRKAFNQIRACLHADRQASQQEKHEAFVLFSSFEKILLKEAEAPSEFAAIPSTLAEWDALRAARASAKKSKVTTPAVSKGKA